MDKLRAVAVREFLATVRTRTFILSVVLMPTLIVGGMFLTDWIQNKSRQERLGVRRIALVDHTDRLAASLEAQIAAFNRERPNQPFELQPVPAAEADDTLLRDRIVRGELYGYIVVQADAITGDAGAELVRRDSQLDAGERLERMINAAVHSIRLAEEGIDPQRLADLRRPVPVRAVDAKTGTAVAGSEMARVLTPFAFMFLLFMGTFTISMGLLTTVIEEKSSRVVEVLLSAVSPTQLMAGKILGMALVGLLLVGVWSGVGLAAARSYHLEQLVSGYRLGVALLYFVPGFLLLASLQAAIGSACNELKEAQSMNFPISLLTFIPLIFWFYISEHPSSPVSILLSYVPPITPFVMVLRVCADPDTHPLQIASTLALLWVSVGVMIWAAAKVFRVGVLMYGKPPSLRELVRWVRLS
ncbi:MAG: ABC transporter permease [Planctomycetota bacterium]